MNNQTSAQILLASEGLVTEPPPEYLATLSVDEIAEYYFHGYGKDALIWACFYDNVDAVTGILNNPRIFASTAFQRSDWLNRTSFMYAAINGNVSIMQMLINHGLFNENDTDTHGHTARYYWENRDFIFSILRRREEERERERWESERDGRE